MYWFYNHRTYLFVLYVSNRDSLSKNLSIKSTPMLTRIPIYWVANLV